MTDICQFYVAVSCKKFNVSVPYAHSRSLGYGNVFIHICNSVHGGFCIMSLPVWLPGPMFLLGVSVSGPMFLLGVSVLDVTVQRTPRRLPVTETPHLVKSGRYAPYWNAVLFYVNLWLTKLKVQI